MPNECANHAKPKPAAKPPSMAPQGLRCGCAAAAGDGAAAGAGCAAGAAFCAGVGAGAGLAASRWVTLFDC